MCSVDFEAAVDRVIFVSLFGLVIIAAVGFFAKPMYDPAVAAAIDSLKGALTGAMGARFGLALPKVK